MPSPDLKPAQVKKLPPRPTGSYDTPLGGVRGLFVRVEPTGSRSFRLRYFVQGRKRWITIGQFPQWSVGNARKEARRLLGLVAAGRDPAAERKAHRLERRAQGSVEEMVERYLAEYARPRKRSADEDERILRKELLPNYGSLKARELTKGHILEVIDEARKRGVQGGLNNIYAVLRKMCRWAVGVDILLENPTATIERPAKPGERHRILSRAELGTYWTKLQSSTIDYRSRLALQIQALTALRIGEVVGARRIEVQLSERLFLIGSERMKAGRPHSVPLTNPAIELFREALEAAPPDSPYVFPSDTTGEPIRARSVVRALSRMQPDFGFAETFTSHDVRRTAVTELIGAGVQHAVVDRVVAHVPTGVLDKHYNLHAYRDEKRMALERWSEFVLSASEQDRAEAAEQ